MTEHDCEAAEGCINTAQGECFGCGRRVCSLHAEFDAHGCDLPLVAHHADATSDAFATLACVAERTMRGDLYPCEECPEAGEYLCVGCDLFLCERHHAERSCAGTNFPQA